MFFSSMQILAEVGIKAYKVKINIYVLKDL